jgi:hypothetical protein
VLPLPAVSRASARRKAEALLERAAGVLARGVRAVSGRAARPVAEPVPAGAVEAGAEAADRSPRDPTSADPPPPEPTSADPPPPEPVAADPLPTEPAPADRPSPPKPPAAADAHAGPAAGDDAATRIDAARARLRARIVPPADD